MSEYKTDALEKRVKKALKSQIKNPNDINANYTEAHIDINELHFNFYHEKGSVVFTIWASAAAKEEGSVPLGQIGINIEKTQKTRMDGSVQCLAFDDVFGKTEEIIITLLKTHNLREGEAGSEIISFANAVVVDGVEGKNKEAESLTEEEEGIIKIAIEETEGTPVEDGGGIK